MDELLNTSEMPSLSRREFLQLGSAAALGLILPLNGVFPNLAPDQYGRIAVAKVILYDRPSLKGKELKAFWRDMVVPISEVTIGDEEPDYNRTWYRIGEEGYAHSGGIQPVQTHLNKPVKEIPMEGVLAEVTVPFTDAYWGPGKNFPFAYRFYYETTYWITRTVQDNLEKPWYRVADDKWEMIFFVPAEHLRIIPKDELEPLSKRVKPKDKRIEVQLGKQLVVAYEYDKPVFSTRAATGAVFSNGRFPTPLGRHMTFHKRPSRHMAAGDLASNGYDLPGVPWICYINEKGVAIHGTYWHNDYGRPRSHGCINLTSTAAKWLFRWTLPAVPPDSQDVYEDFGTQVDVVE
jgi:lipoprotein-anchoring transpeptidase ErfK/SrfK